MAAFFMAVRLIQAVLGDRRGERRNDAVARAVCTAKPVCRVRFLLRKQQGNANRRYLPGGEARNV